MSKQQINITINTRNSRSQVCDIIGERGSAPKRGCHCTRFVPPNASVQWQPDGLTIHTRSGLTIHSISLKVCEFGRVTRNVYSYGWRQGC